MQEAFALSDLFHQQATLTALEIDGKRISPDQKVKIGIVLMELEKRGIANPDKSDKTTNETLEQVLDRKFPGKPGHNPDAKEDAERMAAGLPPL